MSDCSNSSIIYTINNHNNVLKVQLGNNNIQVQDIQVGNFNANSLITVVCQFMNESKFLITKIKITGKF